MTDQEIPLAGTALRARASGALWWAGESLLCVADLHLGKAERLARRGGSLLPPYETAETLDRLAGEVAALAPAIVICLGDSFDDCAAGAALDPADAARLSALLAGRDWIWIAGNHDPGPLAVGGRHLAEFLLGPLVFRHAARPGAPPGEVSGHLHPKLRLSLRSGAVTRPCFLADEIRGDSSRFRRLHRRPVRGQSGLRRPRRSRRAGDPDRRAVRHRTPLGHRDEPQPERRLTPRASCRGS